MTQVIAGIDNCPVYAPAFGYAAVAICMVSANFGSAWGTWKAGCGVCNMGIDYPSGIIKNIIPIVMAGVLGIYGLIVSVIITQAVTSPTGGGKTTYSLFNGYAHLAAGLCCGLSCLAAGGTIGFIGDVGVRCVGLKASAGTRAWSTSEGADPTDAGPGADSMQTAVTVEASNKLYVGLLIMLIFAEALALYGLIVALILTQNNYTCKH